MEWDVYLVVPGVAVLMGFCGGLHRGTEDALGDREEGGEEGAFKFTIWCFEGVIFHYIFGYSFDKSVLYLCTSLC